MEQWLIIGISGVTCSGKTTLAQSLSAYFKEQVGNEIKAGIIVGRVEKIHQDAYFYPMDDPRHKMVEEFHHPNKEIIESLDMDEMVNDIKGILGDDFVLYDTRSSGLEVTNRQNRFAMKQVKDSQNDFENSNMIHLNILIIEGFLVYNHPWTLDICNVKYHLQLPFESCYARRVKRFYKVPDLPRKLSSLNNC